MQRFDLIIIGAGSGNSVIGPDHDDWDIALTGMHIDEGFDPSLGFVPRDSINRYSFKVDYATRPDSDWLRKWVLELSNLLVTDLDQHPDILKPFDPGAGRVHAAPDLAAGALDHHRALPIDPLDAALELLARLQRQLTHPLVAFHPTAWVIPARRAVLG